MCCHGPPISITQDPTEQTAPKAHRFFNSLALRLDSKMKRLPGLCASRVFTPMNTLPHGVFLCFLFLPLAGWSRGFIASARVVGRIPKWRLIPAFPSLRFLCSIFPTIPTVALHLLSTFRISPAHSEARIYDMGWIAHAPLGAALLLMMWRCLAWTPKLWFELSMFTGVLHKIRNCQGSSFQHSSSTRRSFFIRNIA